MFKRLYKGLQMYGYFEGISLKCCLNVLHCTCRCCKYFFFPHCYLLAISELLCTLNSVQVYPITWKMNISNGVQITKYSTSNQPYSIVQNTQMFKQMP